jgi:CBS-domain-containing membrane protein
MDAFFKIYQNGVSGVGVVDAQGRLNGNISASDLKEVGFTGSMFRKFFQNAQTFSNHRHAASPTGHTSPHMVWLGPRATVRDLIVKFSNQRVHRVYICDPDQDFKLIGIISLSDLMTVFSTAGPA